MATWTQTDLVLYFCSSSQLSERGSADPAPSQVQVLSTSDGVSETQTVEMRVLDGPGDAGDKDGREDGRKRVGGRECVASDYGCQGHIISAVTLVARQLCKPPSPTPAKPAEPQPASQDPSTVPSFVRGSSGRTSWRVVPHARPEKEEVGKEAGEEVGKAKQEERKSE